jgi:hypothetical protein
MGGYNYPRGVARGGWYVYPNGVYKYHTPCYNSSYKKLLKRSLVIITDGYFPRVLDLD